MAICRTVQNTMWTWAMVHILIDLVIYKLLPGRYTLSILLIVSILQHIIMGVSSLSQYTLTVIRSALAFASMVFQAIYFFAIIVFTKQNTWIRRAVLEGGVQLDAYGRISPRDMRKYIVSEAAVLISYGCLMTVWFFLEYATCVDIDECMSSVARQKGAPRSNIRLVRTERENGGVEVAVEMNDGGGPPPPPGGPPPPRGGPPPPPYTVHMGNQVQQSMTTMGGGQQQTPKPPTS